MKNKNEIIEEPICIIDQYGNKFWHNPKGQLHRENDLPAIEYINGSKYWWLNNKLHREKGSAIEYADGKKSWHWNGKKIEVNNQEEFEEKLPYLIMKDIHEQ